MVTSTTPRAAYSLSEFARLFGRERTWAYRLVAAGKITTITGFGKAMVPQSEVDRILSQQGGAK